MRTFISPAHVFLVALCGVPACFLPVRAEPTTTQGTKTTGASLLTVTAQVLSPEGKPVPNAQVALFDLSGTPNTKPQIVSTDAQGKFTARIAPPSLRLKEAVGDLIGRVVIVAPHFAATNGLLKKTGSVFRLETGRSISGTVVDEAGKPLQGVPVKLDMVWNAEDPLHSVSLDGLGALQEKFVVKSGADGRWTLDGLPTSGRAVVSLDDSNYSRTYGQLDLDGSSAVVTPLVAKVGARLTGRILLPGNKPLAGVAVNAGRVGEGSQSYGSGVTDKDGRYLISGLDEGNFKITAGESSGEWVATGLMRVHAQVGKTTPAPDLILGHGFFIEGTVLDADTGKPIPGAQLGAQGPHGFTTSTASDEKGHYRVRVVPGDIRLYMYSYPAGYMRSDNLDFHITATQGQKPLAPLRLHQGLTLSGTALDEKGNPATGARLMVGSSWQGASAVVDAAGGWKMSGVAPGDWHHGEVQGQVRFSVAGEWQIVAPQTVSAQVKGPIHLVLRRIALASLQGRVVAPDGTPVAGASLQLKIAMGPGESGWTFQQRTSDAGGRFTATKLRPENKVTITAQKAGYKFLKGGTVTSKEGVFVAEDIVLSPETASFSGRVLDAKGSPVADAEVVVKESDPTRIVRTDATGKFTIASLPAGPVHVMAAHDYDAGEVTGEARSANADTPNVANDITLIAKVAPPSKDLAFVVRLLETLKQSKDPKEREIVPALAMVVTERDPDLALRLSASEDGKSDDENLVSIITRLAHHDPVRAAQWAPAQLEKIKDADSRLQTSLELGIAIAQVDSKQAERYLQQAKASIKPNDLSVEAAGTYSSMAALAGRLGDPDAKSFVELTLTALETSYGTKKADETTEAYAESVADGGAELVRVIIADLSPQDKIRALERAIPRVALQDVVGAQALLKEMKGEMETVAREPGAPQEQQDDGMYHPTPDQSYDVAAYSVVKALRNTDPATALSLARGVKVVPNVVDSKTDVLILAATSQTPAVGLQVLQEAMDVAAEQGTSNPDTMARIAALAFDLNARQGSEFFARAKKQLDASNRPDEEEEMRSSVASYAFYRATIDPAESRLLLEAEWARRSNIPIDSSYGGDKRQDLARAMVAIDINRAIEMASSIPDRYGERQSLYAQIVNFVLTSQDERRTMEFREYGDSDDL